MESLRLSLHVIGVSVWVGGQLVLAALVPFLRKCDPELPKLVAGKFNQVAWAAYCLLIITGIWNVVSIDKQITNTYKIELTLKILVVALSGVSAFLHAKSKSTFGLAFWGALSGLSALSATYIGVLLAS